MTIYIYLSLAVSLIGLLIYLLTRPEVTRVVEVGRIMFWVGLLAFLLTFHHA